MLWRSAASPSLAVAVILGLIALLASGHAVLNKRDARAAVGWIGLIMVVPGLGALLYLLIGINRIERRATRRRAGAAHAATRVSPHVVSAQPGGSLLRADAGPLEGLVRLVERTTSRPLLDGNRIEPLRDGDEAYPAMLEAIEAATRSIALATYIFDADSVGRRFVEALALAQARGVHVRVLIDDAGARYSRPPIDRLLRPRGVTVARFLPLVVPWALPYLNLRNHRKLLVVDGRLAFTGGMNIREGCVIQDEPQAPTRDLHFRVRGPVLAQLLDVFAEDWYFARRERLEGAAWVVDTAGAGPALARTIVDGPDEDLDVMRWAFLGAIASARRTIRIVTPYFLPDESLVTALNVAAMRGVRVDIVLPEKGNLLLVHWAMRGEIWKLLGRGCRVWLTPPPFDHAKLLVIDGAWSLVGSANWDPRSLRLNFELGLECYDAALARGLDVLIDERMATARELLADDLETAPLWSRLRDGVARLFAPYL
ncbi:cardiolipin synthase [soil metagenome]